MELGYPSISKSPTDKSGQIIENPAQAL